MVGDDLLYFTLRENEATARLPALDIEIREKSAALAVAKAFVDSIHEDDDVERAIFV